MSRSITAGVATEIAARFKRPIVLVEILTAASPVRVWTGVGDLIFGGNTYQGTGALGSVQPAEETADLRAAGEVYTLSGVPSALLSASIGDLRQGLPCRRWLGFLDGAGALIADPILLFEGTAAVPTTADDAETCTIRISAESLLNTLKRARVTRYTPEDQATRATPDKGFEYVASLQDRVIAWGRS
jgi:hypothetical protein